MKCKTGRSTTSRNNTGSRNTTNRRNNIGGNVIGSGSYGCVFKPALKCKDKSAKNNKNKVTKLMFKKYALTEYREIMKFKKILKKIPNYRDYFFVDDITKCIPENISPADLRDYESKCDALKNSSITKETINQNITDLLALNIPDGGVDLDEYMYKITYDKLEDLNNLLIDLLLHGIIPMNNLGVYHCDIKGSNVLIKDKTRLIDWGISTEYHPTHDKSIPKILQNGPFQFNAPFASILFNNVFSERYSDFLKTHDYIISPEVLRPFLIDFIYVWTKYAGLGHYNFINNMFQTLFQHDLNNSTSVEYVKDAIEFNFTNHYIINYLIEILIKYTQNQQFQLLKYFNEVYVKIVDIWGFLMCYYNIISVLYKNYNNLNKSELELFGALKQIFIEYLFTPRVTPIPIEKLTTDLKKLNVLFDACFKNSNTSSTFNDKKSIVRTALSIDKQNLRKSRKPPRQQRIQSRKRKNSPIYNENTHLSKYI
jgi:hypothetical protein